MQWVECYLFAVYYCQGVACALCFRVVSVSFMSVCVDSIDL